MKIKTIHWVAIATMLTVLWIGIMAWFSHKYLVEKDPVRTELWQDREQGAQPARQ
jgi:hypothetical protein